jgi:hypothetical protein
MSAVANIAGRLAGVSPGQAITLRFSDQIVGRVMYLRVNAAAHATFGPGNYQIRKPRNSRAIWVARFR